MVRCEYFAFQDDIGKPSTGVMEAQVANIKLAHMFQEKGLETHPDKTCFIVFGSDNFKNKVNEELKSKPLKLGNFLVKQKQSDRYLGQISHSEGVRLVSMPLFLKGRGNLKEQFLRFNQ